MAIRLQCECGKVLTVDDRHAGKTGKCPSCGRLLQIPGPEGAATAKPPEPSPFRAAPPPDPFPHAGAGLGAGAQGSSLPWQDWRQHGFFAALFRTMGHVLTRPREAFSAARIQGTTGNSLLYAIILCWPAMALSGGVQVAIQRLGGGMQGPFGQAAGPLAMEGAVLAVLVVVAPVLIALGTFISTGIVHLCLMLVGGANESLEATYAVICYAQGSTAPIAAVPFCGGLVAGIWTLVIEVIGLAQVHRIGVGRALIAILLPVIVCCGVVVVAFMVFFGAAMAAGGAGA